MKYSIGDTFLVEITDISDTGMGTVIYLNDIMAISDKQIEQLNPYTPVASNPKKKKTKKAHTPEELQGKIFMLSELLAKTIESYKKVTGEIEAAGTAIDIVLEDNEDG